MKKELSESLKTNSHEEFMKEFEVVEEKLGNLFLSFMQKRKEEDLELIVESINLLLKQDGKKLDLNSSDKILENLTLSIDNLTTQINLLREDLRPELKKSEIMRKKKREREEIRRDSQNYIPKLYRMKDKDGKDLKPYRYDKEQKPITPDDLKPKKKK